MAKQFNGIIDLDIRDSKPDWEPYEAPKAKDGAPNVLYIVWDDTGIAAWDIYGGLIEMPNMKRIADKGLRFSNWHTTALCSPTRSCLMTGRNATMNGMSCITEGASGYPGSCGVVPQENGMISEMLLQNGYSTFCVGKWHLTPETESNMASSKRTWPTSRGFERYYGFLGGETNQWYPDLAFDNHFADQPYKPEEGYHLSKDLVDKTIQFIQDSNQIAPEKPWLAYLAFGANHAPHHVPKEWADRYKGKFDMGYEKYREMVLENMKKMGTIPQETELSQINPWPWPEVISEADQVLPWDSLTDDQKKLFTRMAEVYAGFSSYTDHELGRLLDYLEASGQLENTLIIAVSDNGASGEGTPNGSVNENKFFNGWPDDLKENLAKIDELGGEDTYNHYPTGWAWAFNAPYKMFKRYTLEGGIADPCIIAWPKAMKSAAGQVRDQYHHAIDIVPTIMECASVEAPEFIKGYQQSPIQGVSMCYTFDRPNAESTRHTQFYSMLGTRAIYHDGWKAVAKHGAISGKGHFMDDKWELYHVESDRSEVHDLAEEHPEKLKEMIATWFAVAGRNNGFPLDDRAAVEIFAEKRPELSAPRNSYIYHPNTSPVPEGVAPNIRNRSYSILANVEIDTSEAEGVLFSMGSRFGGHTLFVKNHKLHYIYNFLGIQEQHIVSSIGIPTGKHVLGAEFHKEKEDPKGVANGVLRLYIDDDVVAEGSMRTQPGKFGLASGLLIGRSTADPVSREFSAPFEFRKGTIKRVSVNLTGEHYVDEETEARAMLARE
ncbi:MAG: arylsulfatase [Armatimonadota bacterium]|nr:arylsulfatase [bacterium]